jgi:outer membrane protein assembly factor BamB
VVAGDKIFVTSEAGVTFVFKAGPEYEAIASNDLGSNVFASPVICGGQIFLRAADGLYCIAE